MEQQLKIPTEGKKTIYGKLRGSLNQPLIIFVHGLGGFMDEHIFFNGARFFEKHGFSSFRFNLYGWEKDERKMDECTVKTHAQDLDLVINYFRKKGMKKIFVVGHSYGGPTILALKNKDFDGVVFWDPCFDVPDLFKKARYIKELKGYLDTWYSGVVLAKEMVEEAKTIQTKTEKMIKTIKAPLKIITAEKGQLLKGCRRAYLLANPPKDFIIIKKANHTFDIEGTEEELFKETLDWLNKFR